MVFAASIILADKAVGFESTSNDINRRKQRLSKKIMNLEIKLEKLKEQLIDLSNIKQTHDGKYDNGAFKKYKKKYHIS